MKIGRKTDNGFTLIELIVVIAIIAILTGAIIVSINPIQATASKRAAVNMRDALLKGKQYAMTRGNNGTYMEISNSDNLTVSYYVNGSNVETEVISSRKVTVLYNNGNNDLSGSSVYVAFDKGSGACKVFSTSNPSKKLNDSQKRIIEVTAGGVTYDVTLSGLTGKIDLLRK